MGEGGGGHFDRASLRRDQQLRDARKRSQTRAAQTPVQSKIPAKNTLKTNVAKVLASGIALASGGDVAHALLESTPTKAHEASKQDQGAPPPESQENQRVVELKQSPAIDILTKHTQDHSKRERAQYILHEQREIVKTIVKDPTGKEGAPLTVVRNWLSTFEKNAREQDCPMEYCIGVGLIENAGGEDNMSETGARGIMQQMKDAAGLVGLYKEKNGKVLYDKRGIPTESIRGGTEYLRILHDYFGDWGIAIEGYYVGPGNLGKFIQVYAHQRGVTLTDPTMVKELTDDDYKGYRKFVEKNHASIFDILEDPHVSAYIDNPQNDFSPETKKYAYLVLAGSEELIEQGIVKPTVRKIAIQNTVSSLQKQRTDGAVV